ncbi:hypothetical protein [Calothrix sp. PCC 7507]|uniref:hypothetical protein n=1 Tax=Calothrix sp. PCC 7507 TaxID=99598 RepID=UPI00029EE841|nr:hypothetical protein [Calothrix sp. PCC 7507]AFY32988.1 hypothetical protein Cal7507_2564 [Calothrix sp. PCC 7507]
MTRLKEMRVTDTLGIVLVAAACCAVPASVVMAQPAALQLQLQRSTLQNVDDSAGRWQFEGGKVVQNGKQTANYASFKRIVNGGTDAQNTAIVTTTIFFQGKKPPENITLQGSHDFSSGGQIGSVSAASSQYAAYIGKQYSRRGDTVTIK